MKGKAVRGDFQGTALRVINAEKVPWRVWKKTHPDTQVWSLNDEQDRLYAELDTMPQSDTGFRGLMAKDKRLQTKDPVFGWNQDGQAFAVSFKSTVGGARFELDSGELFLYRSGDDPVERSTVAFYSTVGFKKVNGNWREMRSNLPFDVYQRCFVNQHGVKPSDTVEQFRHGLDTWWYNWSLNNPNTQLLFPRK